VTALLIIAVLLPEFLAQLRIALVHGCFAQLTRHDVVVAAIRNARGHGVRAAASGGTATDAAATALPATPTVTLALTFAIAFTLALALTVTALLTAAGAASAGSFA